MASLDALLKAIGVKNYSELNELEQDKYNKLAEKLAVREPDIVDFRKFIKEELVQATREAAKYENSKEKDLFYKAYLRLLDRVDQFLSFPDKIKHEAKQELEQIIRNNQTKDE